MKKFKLIYALLFLLLAAIANAGNLIEEQEKAVIEDCPPGPYVFFYNGEHSLGPGYACVDNGDASVLYFQLEPNIVLDDTSQINGVHSILLQAAVGATNSTIEWAVTPVDMEPTGNIRALIKVPTAQGEHCITGMNSASNWDDNVATFITSQPRINGKHGGQTTVRNTPVATGQIYTACYTWNTTQHCISLLEGDVACSYPSCAAATFTPWTTLLEEVAIGDANEWGRGHTQDTYVDDVRMETTYNGLP